MDGRPIPRGTIAPLISSRFRFVGDYTNPILQPWAAETVKKHGEIELGGVTSPTPNNQCWPEPVPYIFRNLAMQMLQQPERITIIYYDGDQVRRARMNERHPAKVTPSWYGDSVGHYDGDTLVIDTIGVQPNRPFAMVDWYGTPYTEALHVVERYRLIDHEATRDSLRLAGKELFRFGRNVGDTGLTIDPTNNEKALQLQFTVEDEGALTMPWSATITYLRAPATAWPEYICAENLRATYVTKESAVPRADQPDF